MNTTEVSAIGNTVTSSFAGGDAVSNTKIDIMKKVSEETATKLGQKLVTEYCISMNKNMVKNVGLIVDKLDIVNQSDIFETIAEQFFDDNLTDMYISELKATMKMQIKNNLRTILYDHFKSDLKEEKELERKKEQAEETIASQEGGNEKNAAGAGDEEGEIDVDSMFHDTGEEEENTDNAQTEESNSQTEIDETDMMNQIVNKINDKIITDDSFIEETKDGIIKNITSSTFTSALQREIFHILTPQIEKLMKEKVESILDDDEIKNAAMDIIKEQQTKYNIQNKRGGKKHTIKKDRKYGTKYTRKSSQ